MRGGYIQAAQPIIKGDEMARKSRRQSGNRVLSTMDDGSGRSRAGIYARLSVEDNGYGTKDSIRNQVAILKEYVETREKEFCLVKVYVDNGSTGTHFDREEWRRLIEDIKAGSIDCIVVKDFSRMGRNYIEVGNYLEKIFPFLGVRVIAVNENYDSHRDSFEDSMLMNSLINIMNEYYARDISRKVTQAKRTMQKRGECASGEVAYGYKKSKENGKRLTIDMESAHIVKKIFEWRLQKKGCSAIANYLNELALPSPGMYRYMNGNPSFQRSRDAKWNAKHVAGILTNPVYLGHMAQGKTRRSYFEHGGKLQSLPKGDWTVVENTHEPLATQEQFAFAAALAEISRKRHKEQMDANQGILSVENPLRKKIFCGQCGSRLIRRSRVKQRIRDYSYFCPGPSRKIGVFCKDTCIHEVPLMEAVAAVTDRQLVLLGAPGSCHMMERRLSPSDYVYEKKRLEMARYQSQMETDSIGNDNQISEGAFKSSESNTIPVDMLDKLIEKIVVHSSARVEIVYAFADGLGDM